MDKDWKWPTCEKDWKWPTCEMMTHSPCSSIQQGRAVTSHFMCLSAASIVALEAEGMWGSQSHCEYSNHVYCIRC